MATTINDGDDFLVLEELPEEEADRWRLPMAALMRDLSPPLADSSGEDAAAEAAGALPVCAWREALARRRASGVLTLVWPSSSASSSISTTSPPPFPGGEGAPAATCSLCPLARLARGGCTRVQLEDVVVRPDLQGLGWGRRALAAAERLARSRLGGYRLSLETSTAEPFYRRLGFETHGVAMRKRLDGDA